MLTKPRAKRVESITQDEVDLHHWVARLAVSLSIIGQELPPGPLQKHVRKTIGEFIDSGACSHALEQHLRT